MTQQHPLSFAPRLAAIAAAFLMTACGGDGAGGGSKPTLLDAAETYNQNPAIFAYIRDAYPGPFEDFTRIPARNPADETREDKDFIKEIRGNFDVEFIDFFPPGANNTNEINVITKRYDTDDGWITISLVYLDTPMSGPQEGSNIGLYETCDERSVEWFDKDHAEGPVAVFCRLDEKWYAFQSKT